MNTRHENKSEFRTARTLNAGAAIIAGVLILSFCGCTSFGSLNMRARDARQPVNRVLCLWQPAEGRGLDDQPTRGFAGQILFFTADSPTPVEVDGEVTISLFDNHGSPSEQSKPIHQFRFSETWRTYVKETSWGPSYQLFIPYVRKGKHRAECALNLRFETGSGTSVVSEMTHIVLPGAQNPNNPTVVRSRQRSSPQPMNPNPGFESFSIPVSHSARGR